MKEIEMSAGGGQSPLDYNIVLIGFMGTGKSTVARCLGKIFSAEVVEMDDWIAKQEKRSIPDIFETYGEEYFRNLETNLLTEMRKGSPVILSCGGGAAMRKENVDEMKRGGKVVLLTACPETILERVKGNENRPLLKGKKDVESIRKLMEARCAKYEAAADIIIHTEHRTVAEICEELITKLKEME